MSICASPQFVLKVSKYCNLRCNYCYEYLNLQDRSRMSLAQIQALFENIKLGVERLRIERVEFIWHGGEPLLVPVEFYKRVRDIQSDVFTDVAYSNRVQTNLTTVTDECFRFLES